MCDGRDTHRAGLEGYSDVNLPGAASQLEPPVLSGLIIEIGGEAYASHEYIVAHIIRNAIATAFGLFCTKITLDRHLRVT